MNNDFEIEILPHASPTSAAQRDEWMRAPKFGAVFTDHMITVRWNEDRGWHEAQLRARQPFLIDPACGVLHYAQEIFEGLKAYRTVEGQLVLFRPEENARRFARSAKRLSMPVLPEGLFLEAVRALVRADRAWVPSGEGSLYLRPFMFASEVFLGVRASREYIFCVIACPVGPYFKGGPKALSLWVSDAFTRAAPGGTGAAKCGGNYAAGLLAQTEAARAGCDQVLFLDAAEHRWIEELGGMNVFFVMDDGAIATPPLGGTILEGVTRSSLITLARERGHRVDQRQYSWNDLRADAASGRLAEAFACGTAAAVAGIGSIRSADGDTVIGDGNVGAITTALRDELMAMQRGSRPDHHGWLVVID